MTRAGGGLFLTRDTRSFHMADDVPQVTLLRKAAKNILCTLVNSSINGVKVS